MAKRGNEMTKAEFALVMIFAIMAVMGTYYRMQGEVDAHKPCAKVSISATMNASGCSVTYESR
jgi:hypothetical protein